MRSLQDKRDENGGPTGKKPYLTPDVQIYGDLRQVTQAVAVNGIDNGGSGQNMGTHA